MQEDFQCMLFSIPTLHVAQPILILRLDGRLPQTHRGRSQRADSATGRCRPEQAQAGAPHDNRPRLFVADRTKKVSANAERNFFARASFWHFARLHGHAD